jgi:adenosine deaminase
MGAGANVTVSSDDPTFFHTSVAAELRSVSERFGADPRALTERAVAASWMTDPEKQATFAQISSWWARCG